MDKILYTDSIAHSGKINHSKYVHQENQYGHTLLEKTAHQYQKTIHIINTDDHWVTITNVHPNHPYQNRWVLYDSLNDQKYLEKIKVFLNELNTTGSNFMLDLIQS